jgi:hypothetical protein
MPRSRRRAAARLRTTRRAACLAAAVVVAGASGSVAPAAASTAGSSGASPNAMVLTFQTAAVRTSQPFVAHVAVTSPEPRSNLELGATVFSRLTSRSAFSQTTQGHIDGRVIATVADQRLSLLPTDSSGATVLSLDTTGASGSGLDLTDCRGACDGVYPVRIELRDATSGAVLDELVTHLVFINPPPGAPRLNASVVLPVNLGPTLTPDGQQHLDASASAALAGLASSLSSPANASVPSVLAPTPETIQALSTSGRARDQATLNALTRLSANSSVHPVLARPYVPVDVGALADVGLANETDIQMARGAQVLNPTFGTRCDAGTWLVTGGLDQTGVDQLQGLGVSHLVLPDTDLVPTSSRITPTGPFRLAGRGSYEPLGISADSGLASHFDNAPDPVLSAHQLLADLAMIYLDEPSVSPRGVVIEPPLSWIPSPVFLNVLLAGLADDPVVQPVTLDTLFGLYPSTGDLPTRHLGTAGAAGAPLSAAPIRQARQQVGAFASVVGGPSSMIDTMNDVILVSESSELRATARSRYLSGVRRMIQGQVSEITLPPDRSITLTSRTATIPITIISAAPYPVHAVMQVSSDKLSFPHGAVSALTLDHRNKPVYIAVMAKATGDSPLRVSLTSPTGGLLLVSGRFTIRSTATSGVAIALSVGAALFLVAWWILTWIRGRGERNRRLVPSRS